MGTRKRLAVIATPASQPGQRLAPGALDGDAVRARLLLSDAGFSVLDLDPAIDLAEQLDVYFEEEPAGLDTEVLFYASCQVAMSGDGELFLCLDPADPETGDALSDIAGVFRDMVPGAVLFLLECRHAASDDPFRSTAFVEAAKAAVGSADTGVELLIAARPGEGVDGESVSPFTRVALETLDEADPSAPLTAVELYGRMRESERLLGVVPSFAHAGGATRFVLLRGEGESEAVAPQAHDLDGVAGDTFVDQTPVDAELALPRSGPAPTPVEDTQVDEDAVRAVVSAVVSAVSDAVAGPPREAATLPGPAVSPAEAPLPPAPSPPPPVPSPPPPVPSPPPPVPSPPPPVPSPPPPVPSPPPPVPSPPLPPPSPQNRAPSWPAPRSTSDPPIEIPPAPISIIPPSPSSPPDAMTVSDYIDSGRQLTDKGDDEGALVRYKKALGLGSALLHERAEIYVLVGLAKQRQGKRREAIANLQKGLQLAPDRRDALETLLELTASEHDWRSLAGLEERALELANGDEERFEMLLRFATRWREVAKDRDRAQVAYEKARALQPDSLVVLEALREIYAEGKAVEEELAVRRRIADLSSDARDRAQKLFALGQTYLTSLGQEDRAFELFDLSLEADPTFLQPLEAIAKPLAERQEWSELEQAYRRMLDRAPRISSEEVQSEVTWELCRRLGLLFRDHLDDPTLALDAFEDALEEKPRDRGSRQTVVDLAEQVGDLGRAAAHLQALAAMGPPDPEGMHRLFGLFQRLKKPDLAYLAASATAFLGVADDRERIIYEEHRPDGVPKLVRPARAEALELLADAELDRNVQRILRAIAPAAVTARVEMLSESGALAQLDPKARQDPETTTVTAVRSLAWGSHFLGIATPAIYLGDDPTVSLLAMPQEEPTTVIGGAALRGRSLSDLAFLVGRHLVYHLEENRLLLFYPSLEDLSVCFMAAIRIVLPDVPVPSAVFDAVKALRPVFETWLGTEELEELKDAVRAFDEAGTRANLAGWAAAVERTATRAGYVLSGDLAVAAKILAEDPRGLVPVDDKIADLLGYAVSDAHHALREELGIAVEP
jgi:tetratricopeptide (TPR) repeat protein